MAYYVEVKPSKIKQAGLGLFATKKFKVNEIICSYEGELILSEIAESENYHSDYLFRINNDWTIDGEDFNSSFGRFINDPIFIKKTNCIIRANYKLNSDKKRIYDLSASVIATKIIKENEKIYVSYGNTYWINETNFESLNYKQQIEVYKNTTKQGKDWINDNYEL